jgi:hypothetical protein
MEKRELAGWTTKYVGTHRNQKAVGCEGFKKKSEWVREDFDSQFPPNGGGRMGDISWQGVGVDGLPLLCLIALSLNKDGKKRDQYASPMVPHQD